MLHRAEEETAKIIETVLADLRSTGGGAKSPCRDVHLPIL